MLRLAISICTLMLFAAPAAAVPKASKLVNVTLISDSSMVATSHTLTVGVRYKIEPGWHIYWKNAGDAGIPTVVKFELPADFAVSATEFPTPRTITDPGDITIFGYQDEVVLLSTIHVPQSWDLTKPISITANTKFLVCKEVCLPGMAKVEAMIDPATNDSTSKKTFEKWKRACPMPTDVHVQRVGGSDGSIAFIVTGPATGLADNVALKFIPGPADGFVAKCESSEVTNGSFVAKLTIQPLPGQAVKQNQLECLITEENPDSHALTGISFDVPLGTDAATSRPTGMR